MSERMAARRETVRSFLSRLLKDDALAEDLTQETMLRAIRAVSGVRDEAATGAWLIAIALNQARDHFRAIKRRPPLDGMELAQDAPATEQPERALLQAEMSACILDHIARLPARQRDVVLMHQFGGLSAKEAAASLGISQGNARVLLHRGLNGLKASLERECSVSLAADIPCERR
jgi:RNA polymerase sigma-70 factor (ECF subfamily)